MQRQERKNDRRQQLRLATINEGKTNSADLQILDEWVRMQDLDVVFVSVVGRKKIFPGIRMRGRLRVAVRFLFKQINRKVSLGDASYRADREELRKL
jgi:hypothetical protein